MIDFDEAFFQRAQVRAAALQTHLSEPALERLAREVVRRLTSRAAREIDSADARHPTDADIQVLCEALLHADVTVARDMVQRLQARHVTLEVLYSRYLAPAAGRLGTMWDQNRISFAEVTMGVSRIFELVHKLRSGLPPPRITKEDQVLFATVPGEIHSLGVEMAADLFRQKGWDVEVLVNGTHAEIVDRIERTRFLVLGLSSGGKRTAEALALLIHAVRAADPSVYVVVSGAIVTAAPDLVALAQPDTVVATVEDALDMMERMGAAREMPQKRAAE